MCKFVFMTLHDNGASQLGEFAGVDLPRIAIVFVALLQPTDGRIKTRPGHFPDCSKSAIKVSK